MMESYSRRFKSRKIRSSAERTAPPRSTHIQHGDVSSFLIQQGGRRSWGRAPATRRRGGGACSSPGGLRQALRRRRRCWRGGGLRQGRGAAPMHLPTIYRGGGGLFLALQVHWGIGKGGRKEITSFPSPPIVIPAF